MADGEPEVLEQFHGVPAYGTLGEQDVRLLLLLLRTCPFASAAGCGSRSSFVYFQAKRERRGPAQSLPSK